MGVFLFYVLHRQVFALALPAFPPSMVVMAFFTYTTHRQLIVWALPLMTIYSVDKKQYWPLLIVLIGYLIRIIKPDWYFGLVHLGIGGWYYWQFFKSLIAARRRPIRA